VLLLGAGVAAVAAAITILSMIMRSVGEVGGSCADGGPYVSAQPCPDGTGPAMLAVFGLAVFGVIATIWGAAKLDAPLPVLWAWPALFFTLGWNFLDDGLFDPPAGAGVSGGYVFCGVLFWVMGAAPLLLAIPLLRSQRRDALKAEKKARAKMATALAAAARPPVRTAAAATPAPRRTEPPEPPRGPADDLPGGDDPAASAMSIAGRLERLAALHASGELTDDEYAQAKKATLQEELDR